MERRTTLPGDIASVRLARAFVACALEDLDADVDQATAALAISEVVTNALLYGGSDVTVAVCVDGDDVRVEVADDNQRRPVVRHVEPTATSGRGMDIVEAVTRGWGVRDGVGGGKVVWFTLAAGHGGLRD